MLKAVFVGFRAHVCHGVGGERYVESCLVCLASSRFNTGSSDNALMTTCVTPFAFSWASRSVLAKAPHVRFVKTMSLGC